MCPLSDSSYLESYLRSECPRDFYCLLVCLMVFNATFNNISVLSWRSVLLVEELTEVLEKTTDLL